jgi:hypothetical protein
MGWNYNPKDAVECLPEGEYDAELTTVEEKTSKKGNDMLEVVWTVMLNGRAWPVRDYIVQPSGLYKLKMIARALDRLEEFEAAEFDLAAHVGEVMRLYMTVQKSDQFADRNQINGYRPTPAGTTVKPSPQVAESDEHIPF